MEEKPQEFPFKICKPFENNFINVDISFQNYYSFTPGYYRYWKDGFLAGELYTTILNGKQYFYLREWVQNSFYHIQFSKVYGSNKPMVIEKEGKVYTHEGIYLFTLDVNNNH